MPKRPPRPADDSSDPMAIGRMLDRLTARISEPEFTVDGDTPFDFDVPPASLCCDVARGGFRGFEFHHEGAFKEKQHLDIWTWFLRRLAAQRFAKWVETLYSAAQRCESPSEELLLLALTLLGETYCLADVSFTREPEPFEEMDWLLIQPQTQIGKYRVDFQVTLFRVDYRKQQDKGTAELWRKGVVLVECDGHDFHERTKEQASRDKKRDRELQAAGFSVFRYSGSDLWRDCVSAAQEILVMADTNGNKNEPLLVRDARPFFDMKSWRKG